MIKIAMIGAGSVVFSKNLTGDILSCPEFKNATLAYMDIDADRLAVGAALCRKVARTLDAHPTIVATQDRRAALADADFVINMVQIGGMDSTLVDFEIPRKYGLRFTIADTTGPGGLFRALRTYPMLTGLCRDMEELCPKAVLLNYSNPMCMNMQTVFRTSGVRAVGLCHSVQGTLTQLARYLKLDPATIDYQCAGINHMAFYLKLQHQGQDLYPRLFERMHDPAVYDTNKVRFELMRRLGYFPTESSEHHAEYSAHFIPHGPSAHRRWGVPLDEYLRRCDAIVDEFEQMKVLSRDEAPLPVTRSTEYGATIIHAMATNTPALIYGNLPNRGTIAGLPADAIVEAPTPVDASGLRHTPVGTLPPQLLGYMLPHVQQHELFIRAALENRRDYVYHAALADPLTAATLPVDKIVEMCDELIAAHGTLLPALNGKKTLVPASGKQFGPVEFNALYASWRAAEAEFGRDYLKSWHILGPFPSPKTGEISLDLPTPVDEAFARRPDGSIDLSASCKAGDTTLQWKPVAALTHGYVDLAAALGRHLWAAAYAYTEFDSPAARDALLYCGSDDGIAIWLNGQLVHRREVNRYYLPGTDACPIRLRAGRNRLFLKIDNYTYGWGFGIEIPRENPPA